MRIVLVFLAMTSCAEPNKPAETEDGAEPFELLCKSESQLGYVEGFSFRVDGDNLLTREESEDEWQDVCDQTPETTLLECKSYIGDTDIIVNKRNQFKGNIRNDVIKIDRVIGRYSETRSFEDGEVQESKGRCVKSDQRAF